MQSRDHSRRNFGTHSAQPAGERRFLPDTAGAVQWGNPQLKVMIEPVIPNLGTYSARVTRCPRSTRGLTVAVTWQRGYMMPTTLIRTT
jgi:hypothetical protein